MSETVDTFDLMFAEYKFNLKNKEGVVEHYVMREGDGKNRDLYQTELLGRFDVSADGKAGKVKNMVGVSEMLLGRCIFKIKEDGTEELVGKDVISAWPASVREKLHEKATKLWGLDKTAEADAKND